MKKSIPGAAFAALFGNTSKNLPLSPAYALLKILVLYLFRTVIRQFPRTPQETTSPIPTVSIRNGMGRATP